MSRGLMSAIASANQLLTGQPSMERKILINEDERPQNVLQQETDLVIKMPKRFNETSSCTLENKFKKRSARLPKGAASRVIYNNIRTRSRRKQTTNLINVKNGMFDFKPAEAQSDIHLQRDQKRPVQKMVSGPDFVTQKNSMNLESSLSSVKFKLN